MKTTASDGTVITTLEAGDREKIRLVLRRLGPYARVPELGVYARKTSEELWYDLVVQVCVRGSARLLEDIEKDSARLAAFQRATRLASWKRQGFDVDHLAAVLREHRATRFHRAAAEKLNAIATSKGAVRGAKVVLLDGLSPGDDPMEMRDDLMRRCPVFGLKTASNFMIGVGLSHDVVALDTRIIGALKGYLGYNLDAGRVQGHEPTYRSVEQALREVCTQAGSTLAVLDRSLFQLGGMSVLEFVMEVEPAFRKMRKGTRDG